MPGPVRDPMPVPMPAAEQEAELRSVLAATQAVLACVGAGQWHLATPCEAWDVRTVVNHLVTGNRIFARLLAGEPLPPPAERARLRSVDHLGSDPVDAFRAAGEELLAAFAAPGVLEATFASPIGPAPGTVVRQLRITENLVHGWDLASATGQSLDAPEDVAEEALAFSRRQLAAVPRTERFGPARPVGDEARALDRLVAFLGRSVPAAP